MKIIVKSFNGIGDLLFLTPSLRVIKSTYPDAQIVVNTNYPEVVKHNPFVDYVGSENQGVFLGYADPIHCKKPECHHIYADWQIVCQAYGLNTESPDLKPEIYLGKNWAQPERSDIGIQINHKGHWHKKKVWPGFKTFCDLYPCISKSKVRPIPFSSNIIGLAKHIAGLKLVVCAEGGISHIAKAVGTPAIVLYGGFAKPEWNGYDDQINLCDYPSCGPCYNSKPCEGSFDRQCFYKFTPDYVAKQIENILKE